MLEIQKRENVSGEKIVVVQKGAWDCATELRFFAPEDGGESGSFVLGGTSCENVRLIKTATVDQTVSEPITYMKMDIEGAEMHALRGAERQIAKNKPKLAVSVYHKIGDLFEISSYLRTLVPEYRFYLRHHSYAGDDTVLYAVV